MIETLPNGVSYDVLNIGNQGSDNTGVYTVPEGHYFFMGDNRDNSSAAACLCLRLALGMCLMKT